MTDKRQLEKFKQAAREAEADMTEADFKKVVGKLAKSNPPKKAKGGLKKKPNK